MELGNFPDSHSWDVAGALLDPQSICLPGLLASRLSRQPPHYLGLHFTLFLEKQRSEHLCTQDPSTAASEGENVSEACGQLVAQLWVSRYGCKSLFSSESSAPSAEGEAWG